jgi:hypothetical protein
MRFRHRIAALEKAYPPPPPLDEAERERRMQRANEVLAYTGYDPDTLQRKARLVELLETIHRRRLARIDSTTAGAGKAGLERNPK